MYSSALLNSLRSSYAVEIADTPAAVLEAKRLRYQVFVRERAIFNASHDQELETDDFDGWSHHLLIRRCSDHRAVGTTRLVTFNAAKPVTFPIQRVCDPVWLADIPLETTGEISRFALSKTLREGASSRFNSLLVLNLIEGILHLSVELSLTHWFAVMEPTLMRLLRTLGIRFEPAGPMISYYGQRQPAVAEIACVLSEGREKCPAYYNFVTRPSHHGKEPAAAPIAA